MPDGMDEWSRTEILGDPDDPRQFEVLTTNDSVLDGLLLFAGEEAAREYIHTAVYDYRSIERLWEAAATISKGWHEIYQAQFVMTWKQARNQPDPSGSIDYAPNVDEGTNLGVEEDPFGDDDFFDQHQTNSAEASAVQPLPMSVKLAVRILC